MEEMKQTAIGNVDIDMSFNHGLPFFWGGTREHIFFPKIHVMEVGQAVCALNTLKIFQMRCHHSAEQ